MTLSSESKGEIVVSVAGFITLSAIISQFAAVAKHKRGQPAPLSMLFLVLAVVSSIIYLVYGLLLLLNADEGEYTGLSMIIINALYLLVLFAIIGIVVYRSRHNSHKITV